MKLNFLIFLATATFLTSCVSMKHTYRTQDVQPSGIMVADRYVADLDINFNKSISGETSRQHKSESQAKQEAYFNAISDNNVHVLVDPIYSVSSTRRLFGSTSTAKVFGFGALYENPRIAGAGAEGSSSATVSDRLGQLERFAKIEGVQGGLTEASYAIDTRSGCCDGNTDGTDGSSFGSTHLLHASENATSLVDEFEKFLALTEEGSRNSTDLNVGMVKPEKKRGLISKILGKLPIIGRLFR